MLWAVELIMEFSVALHVRGSIRHIIRFYILSLVLFIVLFKIAGLQV